MTEVYGIGPNNERKSKRMRSFSLSHFLLTNPIGYGVMLVLQLAVVAMITRPDTLHVFEVAFVLAIFFAGMVSLQNAGMPSYLFTYFWSGFVYGGFGMILGHQIDLSIDQNLAMQQMNSLTLAAVYLNWMTLIMVGACIVTCFFADHCKGHPASKSAKTFIHVFAISMMMFGVYVGHALNLILHRNTFDRFYLQVLAMSIFFTIGYYCALKCHDLLRDRKKA
ncbi:hypothetical protein PsAD13_02303 [Pseudovibrio sp. Ad13]|uniref:hypothetical protein n=1 Tax=Pseudovibrio sp. Ad13 TaxID=989396 RepID=UPI0007AECD57|nr:hypothetical protein [Pseudovibrio sp. Ad13]KZK84264.1 hypothetical protein PsAD13_02303 [Pseudovibrio sp. Ad13]